jgi:hypothetical protein
MPVIIDDALLCGRQGLARHGLGDRILDRRIRLPQDAVEKVVGVRHDQQLPEGGVAGRGLIGPCPLDGETGEQDGQDGLDHFGPSTGADRTIDG